MASISTGGGPADSGNSHKMDVFESLIISLKKEIENLFEKGIKKACGLPDNTSYEKISDPESQWRNEYHKLTEQLGNLLQGDFDSPGNKLALIQKFTDIKDNLYQQFSSAMIYSKILIWEDLGIKGENFASDKVFKLHEQIRHKKEKLGYIPTKLAYLPIEESSAIDKVQLSLVSPSLQAAGARDSMLEGYMEMIDLVKKTYLYTDEKIEQFKKNNKEQQTLREEVERLYREDTIKKEKILALERDLDKNEEGDKDQVDPKIEIARLETQLYDSKYENEELKKTIQEQVNRIKDANKKKTVAEEKLSTVLVKHLPKLNKIKSEFDDIAKTLETIHQDTGLLPELFKKEINRSKNYEKIMHESVAMKDEAVGERGGLMNKNADLSLEVARKIRLAQQAIAARHEIMEELTLAK